MSIFNLCGPFEFHRGSTVRGSSLEENARMSLMAGRDDIFARVREILTEVLGVDEDGDKSLFKCCCENLKYLAQRTRLFRPQRRFDRLSHQTFEYRANLCANGETLDLAGKRVSKTRVINQSAVNSFFGKRPAHPCHGFGS